MNGNGTSTLPLPAVSFKPHKRDLWMRFKRRLGVASLPSDSLADFSAGDTISDGESHMGWHGRWSSSRRIPTVGDPEPEKTEDEDDLADLEEHEAIVVENELAPDQWIKSAPVLSDKGDGKQEGTQEGAPSLKAASFRSMTGRATWLFFRNRMWPALKHFLEPRFHSKAMEESFQKESWFTQKSVSVFGASFLLLIWVLQTALVATSSHLSVWNKVEYYGLLPAFTLPLLPFAIMDYPKKKPILWQVMVLLSCWMFQSGQVIDMSTCGFYRPHNSCAGRDFLSVFFFAAALPVIALFAMGQKRVYMLVSSVAWIVLCGTAIIAIRTAFLRSVVFLIVFYAFLLWMSWTREHSFRRMFQLRAELKLQYRAKQVAQMNERKTMDSKARFSNYLFHECRVPLNTALLAFANLKASNAFDENSADGLEYTALQSSLSMMSQVLDDVLDFTRMERGGFSFVSRPFSFHGSFHSLLGPLQLEANARGLTIEKNLDPKIDEVVRKLSGSESGDGVVMGDEMRLRQVVSNLTSNATKFTPAGGKVSITTKLLFPTQSPPAPNSQKTADSEATLNDEGKEVAIEMTEKGEKTQSDVVVLRIEVQDTGAGIRRKDLVGNRLFSAYVQTELGKYQGGKGTGLGLGIVRNIVLLSGGRLGVKSKLGEGSTFWLELPFTVAARQTQEAGLGLAPEAFHKAAAIEAALATPLSAYSERSEYIMPLPSAPLASETEVEKGYLAASRPIELVPLPTPQISNDPSKFLPTPTSSSSTTPTLNSLAVSPTSSTSGPPSLVSSPSMRSKPQPMEFLNGPMTCLVVDDDRLTRALMSRMLSRLGCQVSTAENGAVALEILLGKPDESERTKDGIPTKDRSEGKDRFGIVFLDKQMPICGGEEVVQRMRALKRDDLIVGVTANALLTDQQDFLDKGASHVLTKPVSEGDLKKFLKMADERKCLPTPP